MTPPAARCPRCVAAAQVSKMKRALERADRRSSWVVDPRKHEWTQYWDKFVMALLIFVLFVTPFEAALRLAAPLCSAPPLHSHLNPHTASLTHHLLIRFSVLAKLTPRVSGTSLLGDGWRERLSCSSDDVFQ